MSQERLWERKQTELTWTWMVFNGKEQTILQSQEQELGESQHVLLSWFVGRHRVDWQAWSSSPQGFALGNAPRAFQSFCSLSERSLQPHCTSSTEHSISLISFAGKGLKSEIKTT